MFRPLPNTLLCSIFHENERARNVKLESLNSSFISHYGSCLKRFAQKPSVHNIFLVASFEQKAFHTVIGSIQWTYIFDSYITCLLSGGSVSFSPSGNDISCFTCDRFPAGKVLQLIFRHFRAVIKWESQTGETDGM